MSYEPFVASYEIIPVPSVQKPTGIRIYPGITSMSAIWDAADVDQYIVTVSGMKRPISLVSNTNKVYIKSGLKAATTYTLRVVAVKGHNNSQSAIQQFTTHPEPIVLTASPIDVCNNCSTSADCVECPKKLFCLNGICVDCSQFPTVEDADNACTQLSGFYSSCENDGTCTQSPLPSPSPSPPASPPPFERELSTNEILILIGAAGLPLLLLVIILIYLMYKHY